MKNVFLSLVFFLIACSSPKKYFSFVNKAEQSIIIGDYMSADKYYKQALKGNLGFADHYFNAFKVSMLVNDIDFAGYNARKLIEKGLCVDFFNIYPKIKNNDTIWNKLLLAKEQQKFIHYEYKESLELLLIDDQSIGRGIRDSTLKVFHNNYEKLKLLINKYGYPSESLIGITCTPNLKGYYVPPQDLLLLHSMQSGFNGVGDIIKSALEDRNMPPYTFARIICQNQNQFDYCIEPLIMINDTLYIPKICNISKAKINKERKKIGLPTIEMEINAIKYKIKNPENGFRLSGNMAVISGIPKEAVIAHFDLYKN